MDSIFLQSFYIAGFGYYQGAKHYAELSIGSKIDVKLDEGNLHDSNAVELQYKGHKIGYIPRDENEAVAAILKAGHNIFEAVVQQLSPDKHPNQQVRVGLFVVPAKSSKAKRKKI